MKNKLIIITSLLLISFLLITGCTTAGERGRTGAAGAKGEKGDKGTDGLGSINVNYTFTGAEGTNALVTNIGNSSVAYLDFTIPRGSTGAAGAAGAAGATGEKGDKGDTGAAGAAGATGAKGDTGEKGDKGDTGAAGAKGDTGEKGDTGDTGAAGTAASINVNYTFTGAAGTSASVVNIGNTTTALLDFTVPKGDTGAIPDSSEFLFRNGSRAMTGNLSLGSQYINNLLTGSQNSDAVNRSYVTSLIPDTSEFLFRNGSRTMTGDRWKRDVDNSYYYVSGANTGSYPVPALALYGKDYANAPDAGDVVIFTPNATGALKENMRFLGNINGIEAQTAGSIYAQLFYTSTVVGLSRDVDNSYLNLYGGLPGYGGAITLNGKDAGAYDRGAINFWTTSAAGALQSMAHFNGNTNTPTLDLELHRIENVGAATTANDALRYNVWTTYSPSLVWSGTTPTGQSNSCRYQIIAPKTVLLNCYIYASDSKGASLSTISLPVNYTASGAALIPFQSVERYGTALGTVREPMAYTYASGVTVIGFLSNAVGTNGQPIQYAINGLYESA